MNLYSQEMDETINPLEANMGWTIAWTPEDRQFIGREALELLLASHDYALIQLRYLLYLQELLLMQY